jgi:hypothetical protein
MLRWLSCKFMLVAVVAFCFLALIMPNISFAQGKSRSKDVLISFRQIPGPNERALVRAAGGVIKYSYHLVPGIAASVPEAAIDGLSHNPNVTMIEDDMTVYAVDAELDHCWGVERIGAGTVHAGGNTGAEVKVAIIDSGIDYTHPDLNANYVDGYDFVNGDADPMDDHGHGTHCSGIVAAEDNGTGAVGVAPDADLYGLKVLAANGSGSYGNVVAALEWAMSHGIQVTSNSYGSSGYPGSLVEYTFNLAANSYGIINVCAAGNSGNTAGTGDNMIYPARFDSCIAVAATTNTVGDLRASFSSTGQQMELAAPGAGIYSTVPGGGYESWSGTSMACPHVSGVVALMISAGVTDIRATLAETAEDLGDPGWDPQYGYGLVNAVAAVGGSSGSTNNPPVANYQSLETNEDTSRAIVLTASDPDGDTLTYHIVSSPSNGNLSGVAPNVSYTPDANYNGTDSFTFKVNDGSSDSNPATVSINVIAVNDPPVAYNQSVETNQGTAVPVELTANDPEGDSLTYYIISGPSHGSLSGTAPDVTYSPIAGYSGSDSFTFNVYDGVDPSNEATVNINVNKAASPETIHVDSITVTTINVGKGQKSGYAIVSIVDNLGNPISGASVTGRFTDDFVESGVQDVTDSSGIAEFYTLGTAKGRLHLTFCVDNVLRSGLVYNANENIETCNSNY